MTALIESGQLHIAQEQAMKRTFLMFSAIGPHRDVTKGVREQPFWNEHATFIDALVAEGFIMMGGPLVEEGGAMLIVKAEDAAEVREKTKDDPWYTHGILKQESIKRWDIFIDERE